MSERVVIVGSGGLAREMRWLLRDISGAGGALDFGGFVTSTAPDTPIDGWAGDVDWLLKNRGRWDRLVMGIGTPSARLRVRDEIGVDEDRWLTMIHPTARVAEDSSVRYGCALTAGVVVTVEVEVGPLVLLNLNTTVGHDARIGAGCVLNPGANISGGVRIGPGCLIGTGATVLQNIGIGDNATIGASAMVRRDVESGQTVVGVPARPLGS